MLLSTITIFVLLLSTGNDILLTDKSKTKRMVNFSANHSEKIYISQVKNNVSILFHSSVCAVIIACHPSESVFRLLSTSVVLRWVYLHEIFMMNVSLHNKVITHTLCWPLDQGINTNVILPHWIALVSWWHELNCIFNCTVPVFMHGITRLNLFLYSQYSCLWYVTPPHNTERQL